VREILFEGRRKDNGEWVYGDLAHDIPGNPMITVREGIFDGDDFLVDPETVGQYTGFLAAKSYRGDRPEDRKIFEGNVVDFTFFYYGEIEVEEHKKGAIAFDMCMCSFVFISKTQRYCLSDLTFDSESDIEIIGDIHDTPELLDWEETE
jgi:hypothetical protein